VADAPEFERWAEGERSRLAGRYRQALEQLAEREAHAGKPVRAVQWWSRLAGEDPYNSRIALRYMQALEAAGDRAEAIQHASAHTELLRADFNAAPEAEVIALAERLRLESRPPANAPPAPPLPRPIPAFSPTIDDASEGFRLAPASLEPGRAARRNGLGAVVLALVVVLGLGVLRGSLTRARSPVLVPQRVAAEGNSGTATVSLQCVAPGSGVTGWWPGNGNTEDIGGGRAALLHGNATFGAGLVGEALILDGDGDFAEVPDNPALNVGTGDFTVGLWVYFNTTGGEQVLVEKYIEQDVSETSQGWTLTKLEDNSLRFGTGVAFIGHGVTSSPLSLPANTWIHFAARRSSRFASILVNGTVVAVAPFVVDASSTASLKFGHRGGPDDTPGSTDNRGFFLNGRVDEVQFFVGHALSDAEIIGIVSAGRAGKCKTVS